MIDLATTLAAFVLGTALARANSCTVASARRLVCDGKTDWMLGLLFAISWAGLTMAAFALALPRIVVLPAPVPVGWQLFAGGVIMGIGATLNMGCFLGSVAGLGRGDVGFLFTLAGIAGALALASESIHSLLLVGAAAPLHTAGTITAEILLFAPVAMLGLRRWLQLRQRPVLALMVVGLAGGTVYACNPDWSYTSGLARLAASGLTPATLLAESATVAVVLGVVASAIAGGRFKLKLPGWRTALARLGGGAMMAAGAMLVPGGNDTLMLWAIPGLAAYGLIAYAVMIVTIMLLVFAMQARKQRQAMQAMAGAALPVQEQQPPS